MIGRPDFDRNGAEVPGDMIPCLSIRQPYAWLIVQGIKPVENRTWRTNFRGRVLIHAGVTFAKRDFADCLEVYGDQGFPRTREEMVGGIVGEAVIVDCVKAHPSPFFIGPHAFVLEQPKAYQKLIPYGGKLGFFGVPASLIDGVAASQAPAGCMHPGECEFLSASNCPRCASGVTADPAPKLPNLETEAAILARVAAAVSPPHDMTLCGVATRLRARASGVPAVHDDQPKGLK